jgi:hypothetical protein
MGAGGAAMGTGGVAMGAGGAMSIPDAAVAPPKPKDTDAAPAGCNPGAACTMGCTDLCMSKLGRQTCVCVDGILLCGACVLGDGGEPPDCPPNAPGMACDANATLCRYRPEVGKTLTCGCKGDGQKRTWRCE